jgi:hypothetical protein
MATNDGKNLRGVIGPYVFRVLYGKNIVQSRVAPGKMKQTQSTIASGSNFGQCVILANAIKMSSRNRFFEPYMFQNLTGVLHSSLKKRWDKNIGAFNLDQESFSSLNHFNFNSLSKVAERISEWPSVQLENNKLVVTLPSLQVPAQFPLPKKGFQCKLTIGVSLFRLADNLRSKYEEMQSMVFTQNDKLSPAIEWEFDAPQGCLCIVNLYLEYAHATSEGWYVINDKKFNPAGICRAVLNAGEYVGKKDPKKWIKFKVEKNARFFNAVWTAGSL